MRNMPRFQDTKISFSLNKIEYLNTLPMREDKSIGRSTCKVIADKIGIGDNSKNVCSKLHTFVYIHKVYTNSKWV